MSAPAETGKISITPELDADQHRQLHLEGGPLLDEDFRPGLPIVLITQTPDEERGVHATAEELEVKAVEKVVGVKGFKKLTYITPGGEPANGGRPSFIADGESSIYRQGRVRRDLVYTMEFGVDKKRFAFALSGEEYEVEVPVEAEPERRRFRIFGALGALVGA